MNKRKITTTPLLLVTRFPLSANLFLLSMDILHLFSPNPKMKKLTRLLRSNQIEKIHAWTMVITISLALAFTISLFFTQVNS